jgi:hypothetical protein
VLGTGGVCSGLGDGGVDDDGLGDMLGGG